MHLIFTGLGTRSNSSIWVSILQKLGQAQGVQARHLERVHIILGVIDERGTRSVKFVENASQVLESFEDLSRVVCVFNLSLSAEPSALVSLATMRPACCIHISERDIWQAKLAQSFDSCNISYFTTGLGPLRENFAAILRELGIADDQTFHAVIHSFNQLLSSVSLATKLCSDGRVGDRLRHGQNGNSSFVAQLDEVFLSLEPAAEVAGLSADLRQALMTKSADVYESIRLALEPSRVMGSSESTALVAQIEDWFIWQEQEMGRSNLI